MTVSNPEIASPPANRPLLLTLRLARAPGTHSAGRRTPVLLPRLPHGLPGHSRLRAGTLLPPPRCLGERSPAGPDDQSGLLRVRRRSLPHLYYQNLADGTRAVEFYLEGVHCAACVWLVEKLPQVRPGVIESRLDMRRAIVEIRWEPEKVKLSQIAGTLDSLGYPPHPAKDIQTRQIRRDENRRFLIRIGVAAACVGNVMTLSFALYGGVFTGIEAQYERLFRWATMLFGMISLVWPGSLFFRGAWAALRTKTAHLDLPIAIGLAAGGIAGTVNAVLGRGEIYFDSLSMLVLLLLVGRWLQRRQQCWANDSLELLFSLTPTSARRLENGAVVEVPIEAVRPGDLVEVRAAIRSRPTAACWKASRRSIGPCSPANRSPAAVVPGSAVHAGTVNLSTRLVVEVEAVGEATRVGRLMRLVEEHSRNRPPIVQFADRIAGRFVRIVLAVAAITFLAWVWFSPAKAIDNAVALLIVTCPCALGLATPLAVTIAIGRAARRHILVKGGEVFEALGRPGVMLLDKTGTLTAGRISLVSWHGDETLRPLVAALERRSAHPIAQALVDGEDVWRRGPAASEEVHSGEKGSLADPSGCPSASNVEQDIPVCDVVQTLGGGITGTVAGRRLVVGSPNSCGSRACQVPARDRTGRAGGHRRNRHAGAGGRGWLRGGRGRAGRSATAGRGRIARPPAQTRLENPHSLRRSSRGSRGHRAAVRNRDGRRDRRGLAGGQTGGRPRGSQRRPGDHGRRRRERRRGPFGGQRGHRRPWRGRGQPGRRPRLSRPAGPAPILELMHAARSTLAAIRRCFIASICYNSLAGTLAVSGVISPLTAAILMPISSFTVFALAYAVRTFGGGKR